MPKTYLITGANRGIGLELTRQLLEAGECVMATAREPDKATDLQALHARFPGSSSVVQLDVTDRDSIGNLVSSIRAHAIDVLVNNAGLLVEFEADLPEAAVENMAKMFEVNTLGCVRVTRVLLPSIERSKTPVIVNMSSRVGSVEENTEGKAYGYRMSKAALNMFNKSLSIEYPHITCVVMHPGWVRTDMGGPNATLSVKESASGIISVLARLTVQDTGKFFNHEGKELPW